MVTFLPRFPYFDDSLPHSFQMMLTNVEVRRGRALLDRGNTQFLGGVSEVREANKDKIFLATLRRNMGYVTLVFHSLISCTTCLHYSFCELIVGFLRKMHWTKPHLHRANSHRVLLLLLLYKFAHLFAKSHRQAISRAAQ